MDTPITVAQFRADFPMFANVMKYPDAEITLWANAANQLIDSNRWGNLAALGNELFIAHMITLDGMALADASRSGLVGFAKGPVSSEAGDKVSVSYDTAAGMSEGAGHWNQTTFGQRYWQLLMMFGAGPVQVSPCGPGQGIGGFPFFGFMQGGLGQSQF